MFESYLQGSKKPLLSRTLTLGVSVALHAGAIALVIFLSLFYVEELPEPPVTVTFFSAPPPPPPPPPPPAPKAAPRPKTAYVKPVPKPDEVQPPDKPPPEQPKKEAAPKAAAAGTQGGSEGGVPGGVEGGVPGGTGKPEPKPEKPPEFVRPEAVDKLKLSGEMPEITSAAKLARVQGVVIVRICLKTDGTVNPAETRILKSIPAMDEEVLGKVRTWRYKPYVVDGVAKPICFPARFIFRVQ